MDAVLGSAQAVRHSSSPHIAHFTGGVVASDLVNGHSPTLYAAEALLAHKLGLAEAIESNRVSFRAALRARVDGVAVYDNLGPSEVREPVTMLNVVVELARFARDLPNSTGSYSSIRWTSVEHLLRSIETKDPTLIDSAYDPIEICLHGVCLIAAQATLLRRLGRSLFGDEDRSEPANPVVGAGHPIRSVP